jgi:ferredoxin
MAERGLVLDIERRGKRYFTLSPVVIGFFEYTFMRQGSDLPLGELARLFDEYFFQNDRFVRSVFTGETQIGRSLAREEALVSGDHVEILDWERASHLIETASAHAVSTCACRHHHSHLGTACERPQRTCLTLNHGAELLARNGIAERIDAAEAMQILEISKKAGLAQTGDNVQHGVSYICNCCGCCCGMMTAIRRFDIKNAIVSSNWISEIDLERCSGCGLCVDACPTAAIEIVVGEAEEGRKKPPRWAVRDAELCLGCGVCYGRLPPRRDAPAAARPAGLHPRDHLRPHGGHGHRARQAGRPDPGQHRGLGLPRPGPHRPGDRGHAPLQGCPRGPAAALGLPQRRGGRRQGLGRQGRGDCGLMSRQAALIAAGLLLALGRRHDCCGAVGAGFALTSSLRRSAGVPSTRR